MGGGLAGATIALCLRRHGRDVTLLEKSREAQWCPGETLAPEANPLIARLGLEGAFGNGRHLRCPGILSAWGSQVLTASNFIANPHGCGWQVERMVLEQQWIDAAHAAGATIVRGAAVRSVARKGGDWKLETPMGTFSAAMLIDASGRGAAVMRMAGVGHHAYDRLVSIYLRTGRSDPALVDARTVIEPVADGWWYAAPTPCGRTTLAFQTDAELVRSQEWREAAWFVNALERTEYVRRVAGDQCFDAHQRPGLASARTVRLERFAGPGWMAIGDAAIARDPLAGQGMMRALDSAIKAADAIADGATLRFADMMEEDWADYIDARERIYRSERRWPNQPFWHARIGNV